MNRTGILLIVALIAIVVGVYYVVSNQDGPQPATVAPLPAAASGEPAGESTAVAPPTPVTSQPLPPPPGASESPPPESPESADPQENGD